MPYNTTVCKTLELMKDQKNKRENFMKDFLRCDKKSEGDNGKISVFSASAGLYR